jgi:hypothetical protein
MPAGDIVERAVWAVALTSLAACLAVLAAVGLSSWRRTAPLRRGEAAFARQADRLPPGGRTSPITYAPAIAGMAIVVTGYLAAASGVRPLLVAGLTTAGVAVAAFGLSGRVTAIGVLRDGMIVHYAGRPSFLVPWAECATIGPPRWALGGWRIERTDGVGRILMPSDLFGLDALGSAIRHAGLRFDGRRWTRPPRD